LGKHGQCPVESHGRPPGQVPQEPPHPSFPHSFPPHCGVHDWHVFHSFRHGPFTASAWHCGLPLCPQMDWTHWTSAMNGTWASGGADQ
jgi:hypothetical protein